VPFVNRLAIHSAERDEDECGNERSADAAENKTIVGIARRDESVIGQAIVNFEDQSPDDGDCADEQNDRIDAIESERSLWTRPATKVKDNCGEGGKQKRDERPDEGTRDDQDQRDAQAGRGRGIRILMGHW
jgi:hypothetical protein